jgi:hypothetical protein
VYAIFATAVMVLVVFNIPVRSTTSGGGGGNPFEEQTRRLTVAEGASESPKIVLDASGAIHFAWIDGRGGSPGVYYKSTRNGGFTFTGDRPLATGFRSISDVSLSADAGTRTVAAAWAGAVGAEASRVYVRASRDGGQSWGRPAAVGPGRFPAIAMGPSGPVLGYVHGDGSTPTQVRLVALNLSEGGAIRAGRGLLAFNASATDVALFVVGGVAHLVWVDHVAGYVVLAHIAVTLSTGAASPTHLIGTFHANLAGHVSLTGLGSRLVLVWSDDSSGTFDVKGQMSLDGGATWPVTLGIAPGPSRSVTPAASLGAGGSLGVAWQDNRTGTDQVFGRLMRADGNPATPVFRVSASPTGAATPTVAFGAGRDLAVAWSDARDSNSEIYADLDLLLDRPRHSTLATYVKRLADTDFAPPPAESRAQLLGLIRNASSLLERREESATAAYLRNQVMTRFDGSLGGDARNDLVVNATAQADLTRLANGILQDLQGGSRGTRAGDPDPPPPGDGPDPPPEPTPGSGGSEGAKPVITKVAFSNVRATAATVSWVVFSPDVPISGSFVDWGLVSISEHRSWDNTTPYQVTVQPLQLGKLYKVRAGAKWGAQGEMTAWSNTFSLYVGVSLDGIRATDVSSDRASIEWTTNLPATSSVSYGKNESNLATTVTGVNGTLHKVALTGLGMRETYVYRVKSVATTDASLFNESGTFSFETVMQITNLTHVETLVGGSFNVTFTWDTNFNATSQIRYGENTTLYSRSTGTAGYHHVVTVHDLRSKTAYYWQAYSEVWNGTYAYSGVTMGVGTPGNPWQGNRSVYVPPEPKSESVLGSAPIVAWGISIVNVTFDRHTTSITAKWNTTYRANAIVKYKTGSGSWITVPPVQESTLTHSVIVSPLATYMTYTFLLNSTSSSNASDIASSGTRNATTKNIALQGTPTSAALITEAWVNWSTTASGSHVVRYGVRSISEYTATNPAVDGTSHSVHLTGLLADTTYRYRVESAANLNKNDVAVDAERTFRTMVGPNDANTSLDAAPSFASALQVEPGTWSGWLNPASPYFDASDYFKFQVFANQQIRAKMVPASGYDYDLYFWRPSNSVATQSTIRGAGAAESLTWNVGSESGWWRVEVRRYDPLSNPGRGDYALTFNATGGGVERFVVDVGGLGGADTNNTAQTPGISVGANWTGRLVSNSTSTATDAYLGLPFPDYRQVSPANGSFYLNLHRTSWERYNDYLFTLQYYSTQDTNVSVWNGAGWVTLAVVPGQSNWRAFSFLLEHTLFYDAEPSRAGRSRSRST